MTTIEQATAIIADQCSAEQVAQGVAYADEMGYEDAEEFFSLAMSRILYSDAQLEDGARFAMDPGSLDDYSA